MRNAIAITLTIPIFLLLLLSSGCSNPFDTIQEQNKKIDELTGKVTELTGRLDKCGLESQEKCAKGAQEFFYNEVFDKLEKNTSAGYINHYNKKLNKCFIEITSTTFKKDGSFSTSKTLYDAFEVKEYAYYLKYVPKGEKYDEVNPVYCKIFNNFCKTEAEFDAFVKKYMEEDVSESQ